MNLLLTLAAALAAAALLLAAGSLLYRAHRAQRAEATLQSALTPRTPVAADAGSVDSRPWWKLRLEELAAIGHHFEDSRLQKALLAPEDRLLLEQAGWNHSTGTAVFLALRVLLAAFTPIVAILLLRPAGLQFLAVIGGGIAAGILLPKFALKSWATRLRRKVSDELPLLIDLLRLLQGVGFSMDQSLQMLGDKLKVALPVLGNELQQAHIAYTHGRSRAQSLRRLSESFGDDNLRSLMQMVLQVHQHGGAVQDPLRQFGERLREQRRMEMKEKVGKLSVKMTMVMMLTLLPALMLVLAGPAILALADALTKMG